ncbi:hypothetical protein DFR29_101268 [Tahibacter aquaticus]|uniref:Uncharacterized protein n=1 Tax=Tahibacter aquaticus TaxID=520092 RepID=A0A4V3DNJ2_9GAMM|nr:hypothetical protein DFR29_101268 [Tahibacter aquaticus]
MTCIRFVTIPKFSEVSGYAENAMRTNIRDGMWLKDVLWVKAPDARVLKCETAPVRMADPPAGAVAYRWQARQATMGRLAGNAAIESVYPGSGSHRDTEMQA